MSRATPATRALDAARISYRLHTYSYDPDAASIGLHAATALGVEPARMLKTLLLSLDGKPACAVLPSNKELSLKKLAATLGGKHATLLASTDAERISGYHIGGISPFGQRKRVPLVVEISALQHATIYCNGGQRGLQIELDPKTIVQLLSARTGDIATDV